MNKKLLFIAPTSDLKAGGEISHFELIQSAIKRGYTVAVVLPGKGDFYTELKKLHIKTYIVNFSYWSPSISITETAKMDFEAINAICSISEDFKPDLLITNTLNMPWGALAAALKNIAHVWIVREFPVHEFKYLENRYDFVGSFSNRIIANSKKVAEDIIKRTNYNHVSHFFSYVNVVDKHLNTKQQPPRLVCVGNIQSRKNQLQIVQAADILNKTGIEVPEIVYIGHPSEPEYLNKILDFANKTNLSKKVSILPFTKNPWQLIYASDIFLQTSTSESIGRTTTEAMKLGVLCIGADIPGTKEAFELGGGVLFDTTTKDLARKISEVLNDPVFRKRIVATAQKNALKNMSEKLCHDPFFKEVEEVVGAENPRKELGHIYPYFHQAQRTYIDALKRLSDDIDTERNLNYSLSTKIQAIESSRSWKVTSKINDLIKKFLPGW